MFDDDFDDFSDFAEIMNRIVRVPVSSVPPRQSPQNQERPAPTESPQRPDDE